MPEPDIRPTAAAAPIPGDSGLGVPPFRPAPPKEGPTMSRPPFPSSAATPGTGTPSAARPLTPPMTGSMAASSAAAASTLTSPPRQPGREQPERRTLVVGRGISVQGLVQDAERLEVEGTFEASMIRANELAIAHGGVFKGEIEVEEAEIAGTIDGTVTARASLIVRATGKVLGTARCRRLQVEDGGQITGRIEMITDQPVSDIPPRVAAETVD